MSALHLEAVEASHREAFQEMAREFRAEGDERFAEVLDDWETHLQDVARFAQGTDLPAECMPQSSFLAFAGEELVGGIRVRHRCIEVLERDGGNIGYEVRPSARGRGHAHRILALALVEARRLGLPRVLLTAQTDNLASIRTIQRAGGRRVGTSVSHHSFRTMARFHIDLAPLAQEAPGA